MLSGVSRRDASQMGIAGATLLMRLPSGVNTWSSRAINSASSDASIMPTLAWIIWGRGGHAAGARFVHWAAVLRHHRAFSLSGAVFSKVMEFPKGFSGILRATLHHVRAFLKINADNSHVLARCLAGVCVARGDNYLIFV